MTPIIAGRFEQERSAQRALEGLRRQGFAAEDVSAFLVGSSGQYATRRMGGDCDARAGATQVRAAALEGAAVGAAVGLRLGLAAGAAADSVGEAATAKDPEDDAAPASPRPWRATQPARRGRMLVAVRAPEYAKRLIAVNVLLAYGARDVERADGSWVGGRWVDFDPLKSPRLVDLPAASERWIRRR